MHHAPCIMCHAPPAHTATPQLDFWEWQAYDQATFLLYLLCLRTCADQCRALDGRPMGRTLAHACHRGARPQAVDAMDPHQTAAGAVLVGDDDEVIRTVMCDALTDEGFTVYAVPDGTPAFQRMQEQPEGLVVALDLTMPGLDGLAVLRGVSVPATASPDPATFYGAIPTGTRHDFLAPPAAPFTSAELVTLSAAFLPHPVSMAALVCAVAEAAVCATSRTRSGEEEEEERAGETVGRGRSENGRRRTGRCPRCSR
jgi:CheY-like chemotaxis protein